MLRVNQVCHGVCRCVKKMIVALCQAWSESQWAVLMRYLTMSTNVRRYQTHHRWQLFFREDSAQVHCVCNTIQLSENVIFAFPRFARYRYHATSSYLRWRSKSVFWLPTLSLRWFSHFPVLRGTGTTPPQVIWGGVVKASFDCLLYRWHFCQKMSKSILSCPSYSKPNVGQTHDVNRNHKVFLDNFPTLSKLNDFLQFR